MPSRFKLQQVLLSLSGDAWIEDDAGNRVYEVDGKAFAIGRTLDLLDPGGTRLLTLHQRVLSFRATFEIKRDEVIVATVQKAILTLFGDRFSIERADGPALEAKGDFLDHEFVVRDGDDAVVTATRSWFSMHDAYGVEVAEGFDDALGLAIVIAIGQLESAEHGADPAFGGVD